MERGRTPPTPPARRRGSPARATLARLERDGRGGQSLNQLLTFAALRKIRVDQFARLWGLTDATARRDLRVLCDAGCVRVLQGRVAGRGGSEKDLYYLAPHGARVLTGHLGLPPRRALKAPTVALDAGAPTKGGLVKRKVAAKPWQDRHDLYCVDLAIWLGAYWADGDWRMRAALGYTVPGEGRSRRLIPDFYQETPGGLWCVELENTAELRPIRAHYRRYQGLFADLRRRRPAGFRAHLTVVLAGAAATEAIRRLHERAYAGAGADPAFGLSLGTLGHVLAGDPAAGLAPCCAAVDHERVRSDLTRQLERQLDALRGGRR